MRDQIWIVVAFIPLVISTSAWADDVALGAKLDAIEKRLAHIEAMEQARGSKTPFTVPLLGPISDPNAGMLCRKFGFNGHMVGSTPGVPSGMTLICFEP